MRTATETLDAFAALERRYDGPIPEPQRRLARHGSETAVQQLAAGQVAFFGQMVRGQIRAIRLRRAEGSAYPEMLDDLRLYRREWRRWQARARCLAAQNEAESPPSTVSRWPLT